jgi:hypothetical protein
VKGCTTWDALGRVRTPVLLIVNSRPADVPEIEAAITALTTVAAVRDLRVVAPVAAVPLVGRLGVVSEHIRPATVHGAELELNFFLEHEQAFEWVARHRPATFMGTAPHSLYNEEVKEIFESRVLMFLGGGTLLAHVLPAPFLYRLRAQDLIVRSERPAKLLAYRTLTDQLLADFHAQWIARGAPAQDDTPDYRDVADTFARHFGRQSLTYDEQSRVATPIAVRPSSDLAARVRRARRQQFVRELRARLLPNR